MEEDQDPECPSVSVSNEEKRRIRLPWKNTLIVKLLGRIIGYTTLLNKINFLWRPKAMFEVIALDNGYFLVFSSVNDYEFAKYGGPWMIFDHHLTVQPWRPNFDTNQTSLRMGSHSFYQPGIMIICS